MFSDAQALGNAVSKRNVEWFSPQNINNFYYRYGKKTGFSNEEIADIENNSILSPYLQRVYDQFGWNNDAGLTPQQRNKLKNEAITGMLAGITYDEDWHYNQRKDDPLWRLNYQKALDERNGNYPPVIGENDSGRLVLPELDFGIIPLERNQIDNNKARNEIINDKNIVTGVVNDVNGRHYQISKDYVQTILDGLNGR